MSFLLRNKTLVIPNTAYQSNIITMPPDAYLSTLFVPDTIVGTDLLFFGDLGDGDMRQLNFIFDLTSTAPYYKGQVVTNLASQFVGLTRLQVSTGETSPQTSPITIVAGFTY